VCTQSDHEQIIAIRKATPLEPLPDLLQVEQAAAREIRVATPIGLAADRKLTQLHPPAATAPLWARTIATDEAFSRFALRFAAAAPTYRTRAAYIRAATRYESRDKVDNQEWDRTMRRLKVSGCLV
jgi:hypothetical protein